MMRPARDLRPHPLNVLLYGPPELDAPFLDSVRAQGVLTPLLIVADGSIVSGHRRHAAALALGIERVPVTPLDLADPLDVESALIEANRQRTKTEEQQGREQARTFEIEQQRAALRLQATAHMTNGKLGRGRTGPETFPDPSVEWGEARELAARKHGTSGPSLQKRARLVKVLDGLDAAGDTDRATALRSVWNKKGVHSAYRWAQNQGLIARPEPSARTVPILPAGVQLEVADATQPWPAAEGSIDLILTSPPYGLDMPYADSADPAEGWERFMAEWLAHALRAARPDGGRLALNVPLSTSKGGQRPVYALAVRAALAAGWLYRWTVLWPGGDHRHDKTARGSVDSPAAPHVQQAAETIAVFHRGEWRREPPCPPDIAHADWLEWTGGLWTFAGEGRGWEGHPAPFPAELARRLLHLLSFPGDIVCDPFLGSGTTAVVAAALGRPCVGFDISADYVAAAHRRLGVATER